MNEATTGGVGRLPPYSEEAERAVLGALMFAGISGEVNGAALITGAISKAKLGVEAFYVPAHQCIFETIKKMVEDGKPVDLITVPEQLKACGNLERVGGQAFIERLYDSTVTVAHTGYHIEIMRKKWLRRRMIYWGMQIQGAGYEEGEDDEQTILGRMLEMGQGIAGDLMSEARTNAEVMEQLIADWETAASMRRHDDNHVPGLKTPYRRYDQILGGLQPGLHFVGGKSSAGKTAFAINIADWFAENGYPGLMIQLDDTHEDVVGRIVAMKSAVSLHKLKQGFGNRENMAKVREAGEDIKVLPMFVIEECEDVVEACAQARFYKVKHRIEWIMIDYVQVLDADGNPRDDERQRLAKVAKHLKRLWKELKVPIIVISQTSKYKDADDDGLHADMSDLFGASELFHAATTVTILKKVPGVAEQAVPESGDIYAQKYAVAAHIVKNKHGPKDCMVYFWFVPKYFYFWETEADKKGTSNEYQMTWEQQIANDQLNLDHREWGRWGRKRKVEDEISGQTGEGK